MILFLDFDGVLHPDDGRPITDDVRLCNLPRLEALLREFPHVRVVISSMWREQFSFETIVSWFSEDIRTRIVGITPLPELSQVGALPLRREADVIAWLDSNGGVDQAWVALDDAAYAFRKHGDRLVACKSYIGFDDAAEERLREHFERSRIGRRSDDDDEVEAAD